MRYIRGNMAGQPVRLTSRSPIEQSNANVRHAMVRAIVFMGWAVFVLPFRLMLPNRAELTGLGRRGASLYRRWR